MDAAFPAPALLLLRKCSELIFYCILKLFSEKNIIHNYQHTLVWVIICLCLTITFIQ